MHKPKSQPALILLLMALGLGTSLLIGLSGQTATEILKPAPQTNVRDSNNDLRATFPVVEYSQERSSDASRKAKSLKYGKIPILDPSITANSEEVAFLEWETGLPALPVDKSQIIVVGKVVEANAFLSNNEVSVYSEFKIEIEDVLKNESVRSLERSNCILAERQGGIVRFPSGFEKWFHVAGQRMPTVNGRYLFFLSYDFPGLGMQERDLYLLTAYELKGKQVVPLDDPAGGTHPIARKYKGKEASVLFEDLYKSLRKSSIKSTN